MDKTYSMFFQGALIGGFLGAAAALLFAPKSGKELRADVKESTREAQAIIEDAKRRAVEWKEGAEQHLSKVKGIFARA